MHTAHSPPTVAGVLAGAIARLEPAASAVLDAQLLLAHALGCARSAVLARGSEPVTPAQIAALRRLLERRARGEPLAYVTGRREFWSLELQVTSAVLVPRPTGGASSGGCSTDRPACLSTSGTLRPLRRLHRLSR